MLTGRKGYRVSPHKMIGRYCSSNTPIMTVDLQRNYYLSGGKCEFDQGSELLLPIVGLHILHGS